MDARESSIESRGRMLIPKGDVSVTPAGCRAEIDRRELSLQEDEVGRAQAATRVSRLNEALPSR